MLIKGDPGIMPGSPLLTWIRFNLMITPWSKYVGPKEKVILTETVSDILGPVYPRRRLIVRSHRISKPGDLYPKLFDRSEI